MTPSLRLSTRQSTVLYPASSFHFDATFHKPDHFPSGDNAWEPGRRWQTMLWEGRPLGLKLEGRGTIDRPAVRLSVWSADGLSRRELHALAEEIEHRMLAAHYLWEDLFWRRKHEGVDWLDPLIRM